MGTCEGRDGNCVCLADERLTGCRSYSSQEVANDLGMIKRSLMTGIIM